MLKKNTRRERPKKYIIVNDVELTGVSKQGAGYFNLTIIIQKKVVGYI